MNSFLRQVSTRCKHSFRFANAIWKLRSYSNSYEVEKGGGASMMDEHITPTVVPKATCSQRVLSAILQQVAHVSLDLLSHILCVTACQEEHKVHALPSGCDSTSIVLHEMFGGKGLSLSFRHTSFVLALPPGNQSKQSTEKVLIDTFCIVQALAMCEYSPRSFIS